MIIGGFRITGLFPGGTPAVSDVDAAKVESAVPSPTEPRDTGSSSRPGSDASRSGPKPLAPTEVRVSEGAKPKNWTGITVRPQSGETDEAAARRALAAQYDVALERVPAELVRWLLEHEANQGAARPLKRLVAPAQYSGLVGRVYASATLFVVPAEVQGLPAEQGWAQVLSGYGVEVPPEAARILTVAIARFNGVAADQGVPPELMLPSTGDLANMVAALRLEHVEDNGDAAAQALVASAAAARPLLDAMKQRERESRWAARQASGGKSAALNLSGTKRAFPMTAADRVRRDNEALSDYVDRLYPQLSPAMRLAKLEQLGTQAAADTKLGKPGGPSSMELAEQLLADETWVGLTQLMRQSTSDDERRLVRQKMRDQVAKVVSAHYDVTSPVGQSVIDGIVENLRTRAIIKDLIKKAADPDFALPPSAPAWAHELVDMIRARLVAQVRVAEIRVAVPQAAPQILQQAFATSTRPDQQTTAGLKASCDALVMATDEEQYAEALIALVTLLQAEQRLQNPRSLGDKHIDALESLISMVYEGETRDREAASDSSTAGNLIREAPASERADERSHQTSREQAVQQYADDHKRGRERDAEVLNEAKQAALQADDEISHAREIDKARELGHKPGGSGPVKRRGP